MKSVQSCVALAICAIAINANAQTSPLKDGDAYTASVQEASCEVVAKSTSTSGAITGGVVGSAAGAVGARLLFGKEATGLGALFGGAVGGFAGEEMTAKRTYNCMLKVNAYSFDNPIYVENIGRLYNRYDPITIVRVNGSWRVKP